MCIFGNPSCVLGKGGSLKMRNKKRERGGGGIKQRTCQGTRILRVGELGQSMNGPASAKAAQPGRPPLC